MKTFLAWSVVIAAGFVAMTTALPARVSYCTMCGAELDTRIYRLRLAGLELYRRQQVVATPFSKLLEDKHLVAPHRHQWLEPRLAADPLNEFGPKVIESIGFLNAPRVVNFTSNVADYVGRKNAMQWTGSILQPRYSRVVDGALRYSRVPAEGFSNRDQFLHWWSDNSYAVYNRLREVTEPD